jgi:hypothetical protein
MGFQEIFKSLLLRHIEIERIGISGKLNNVLFSTENNGFSVELSLSIDGKNRSIKIPSPFVVEHHEEDKLIYLDYRIKTIFNHKRWTGIAQIIQKRYTETPTPISKFYDSILEISYK